MKLNDQKSNSPLFPSAYNTNMTASFKYLSRESSAVKADKSILKSPSQIFCKSNRGSDKKVRIQESVTKGSVQGRNTSQFGRVSVDILNGPPMRSLNREDREKLILTLIQQVKQQNSQIQQLEGKVKNQEELLDELNLFNEKYAQKEQYFEELLQNQNKINSTIQQIAQLKEIDAPSNDNLDIINKIYEDEVDLDMAIKWRNARLQFNFLDALYRGTKYSKKIKVLERRREDKTLQNCFKSWKFICQKNQLLNQFAQVQELRTVIQSWMNWKEFIQNKKQYNKNLTKAKQFHDRKLLKKSLFALKNYYLQLNFKLKDFAQITKEAVVQLERIKVFKIFSQWILWVKNENQKQKVIYQKINNYRQKQMKGLIQFLKLNVKFHQDLSLKVVKQRTLRKTGQIFNQFKQNWKLHKFRENQIKSNRNYFIKFRQMKKWIKEFSKLTRLNYICEKIQEKKQTTYLQNLFNAIVTNCQYKKKCRQNEIQINKKYENRIANTTFMLWLGTIYKRQILVIKEQNSLILKYKDVDYQQQNDSMALRQMYESTVKQVQACEEQIANYKILVQNGKEVERELTMQNSAKEMLAQIQTDETEIKILREQYNQSQQQLRELRQQQKMISPIRNMTGSVITSDHESLRKQVEMSTNLLNDQKHEYNLLQNEYAKLVGGYEKKIKEIEQYYMELCEKQKLQIERLMKENQNIKNENHQNLLSRNKLMDELNIIHESFKEDNHQSYYLPNYQSSESFEQHNYARRQRQQLHSQPSPSSDKIYTQQSPIQKIEDKRMKEEATSLREDIKRRLATLKTQMDQQM